MRFSPPRQISCLGETQVLFSEPSSNREQIWRNLLVQTGSRFPFYPIAPGIPLICGTDNLGAQGSVTSFSGSPWNSGQRARCLRAPLVGRGSSHTWTGQGAMLSRLRHWQAPPSAAFKSWKWMGPQRLSQQTEWRLATAKVQIIKFNLSFWTGQGGFWTMSAPACRKREVRGALPCPLVHAPNMASASSV